VPIYEYQCEACGKRSSALLSSWGSPDPACPHCGEKRLHRLISTFATTGRHDASDDDDFGGDEGYGGEDGYAGDSGDNDDLDDDW